MQHIPIRVVEELTGVPATTIRAWEKRYGCPAPIRSAGGHRLYSTDDVDRVRRIRKLTQDGLPVSIAIERLSQITQVRPRHDRPTDDDPNLVARQRILEAVNRFDPEHIEMEIRRALMLGSPHAVYKEVLIPVMATLSDNEETDSDLFVAQSHLVSEVMRRAAQDLHRVSRPGNPIATAVLACVTDESHTLPLYVIALGLHQRGIRTVVLGAQTSP
ncbi:MAG: MerR family transcriptional regulator, partial [Myxococcota bacterium]|nr:MerR family transcriptional regulator [Myxococcota bacterium]